MPYIKILLVTFLIFNPLSAYSSEPIEFGDWFYTTGEGLCAAGSDYRPDFKRMTNEEFLEYMEANTANGYFLTKETKFGLGYHEKKAQVEFGFMSLLISLTPGVHKAKFQFDNSAKAVSVDVFSVANIPEVVPGLSAKNYAIFDYKEFLRVLLPLFQKYSRVSISVDGKKIRPVSLVGFSKAYQRLEKCTKGKVTGNLYDPF